MRAPDKAVLLITHYQRLLDYVRPDFVHVLADGRIVRTGGAELAHELEREGLCGRWRREHARILPVHGGGGPSQRVVEGARRAAHALRPTPLHHRCAAVRLPVPGRI